MKLRWALLAVLFLSAVSRAGEVFYVSTDGDDAWDGRSETIDEAKKHGPLATLAGAREAIRKLRKESGGGLKQPVSVRIARGTYFLKEPLVFTPADSGTEKSPITYESAMEDGDAGHVVISAGKKIEGWKEVEFNGHKAFSVELPDVAAGKWYFRELWVDGKAAIRARGPKKGYYEVAGTPDASAKSGFDKPQRRFEFRKGDLPAIPGAAPGPAIAKGGNPGPEIIVFDHWIESRLPIENIDSAKNIVSFSKGSQLSLDKGDPYYLEGAPELCDSPGEWFLNRQNGRLYYLPRKGEEIQKIRAIAPVVFPAVKINGNPDKGQFVEHLIFRGMTFSHGEWELPAEASGAEQGAAGVGAMVRAQGARACRFENCLFQQAGTWGIQWLRGCQKDQVSHCIFRELGAGAVCIGEQRIAGDSDDVRTSGNEVSDCEIYNCGLMFPSAVGIWIGQSSDNLISHNLIHDLYYSGISAGWTWGYGPTQAKNNIIEFNHIHHIGQLSNGDGPVLSDMGAIYTLGVQPGTIIRNNLIHDVAGRVYGGWGIYFDEGSSNIVAENNIVYRTTHGGFHHHYGQDDFVRNNIFAFGRDAQLKRTDAESHHSFTFTHNIVYYKTGTLLEGDWNQHLEMDHNLYWHVGGGEIRFAGADFATWQARGMDAGSLIADPRFVDPDSGDFSLKSDSPAKRIGFMPIDMKDVGPRKR